MAQHVGGRLTVAKVKAATTGKHPDGANLWLQVGPSGSKSWYLRYTLDGHTHEMGLGPYPLVSLADARDKATIQRRLLLDGIDPIEARDTARQDRRPTITFSEAAKQYVAGHEKTWRSADHARQWRNSLANYVLPAIGRRAVNAVDTQDVLGIVEPLWQDKTETASRVANRIALILDWATARKLRSGDNPARWAHLAAILPAREKVQKVAPHPALPYAELPGFMAELRRQQTTGARAAELLILTATRTSEIRYAVWSEFDLEARQWVIPAERMKAHRDHRLPLSTAAMAILTALPRTGDRLFAGMGEHALDKAVKRISATVTVHGFRSTFRQWAAEQGVDRDVAEMALAHTVGSAVERAYQRSDMLERRRQVAEAWASLCAGETVADNVVHLRA